MSHLFRHSKCRGASPKTPSRKARAFTVQARDFRLPLIGRTDSILLYSRREAFDNFGVAQCMITRFRPLVDTFHQIVSCRNAAPLQPEQHIRLSAHGADVDDLL